MQLPTAAPTPRRAAAARRRVGYRRRLVGRRRGRLGQDVRADTRDRRLRRGVDARRLSAAEELASVLDGLEERGGGGRDAGLERVVAGDGG